MALQIHSEGRLRIAALSIILGLVIELVSLYWTHPAAFLLFAIGGGAFFAIGILLYLYGIIWRRARG